MDDIKILKDAESRSSIDELKQAEKRSATFDGKNHWLAFLLIAVGIIAVAAVMGENIWNFWWLCFFFNPFFFFKWQHQGGCGWGHCQSASSVEDAR